MATIGIVYYSMYGTTHQLASVLAEGVEKVGGEAHLRRVPELIPDEVVAGNEGYQAAQRAQTDVREAAVDELVEFDGILFGSPTRYGSATSQLQSFLDQTGGLWQSGGLVGKPAGFFTGAATIHGGHESTILSMATFAFHHGMVIVPAGYAIEQVGATRSGGGPYGPSHWSPMGDDPAGDRKDGLDEHEIQIALQYADRFHGITERLAA
jgi:NAD(P)H dehydrogenase (quinone)